MKNKFNVLVVFLWLLSIVACKDNKVTESSDSNGIDPSFLSSISTTKAVLANQHKELILTGKVEADPEKTIHYLPLISGVIEKVHFSFGDKVRKGQVLIDIRSTELSALQSEVISMETEVKIAERELNAAQNMFDDNILSEKELLEAQAKLKQAQAAFERTQADVSVFGANKGNGTFSITSPINGYITYKNASAGSTVSAESEALFTVVDLSNVWITANVYASDLLLVKEGMEVKVSTLSYPGEEFTGKIDKLSHVFDPEDKALKATIILANNELKFKPEMPVVVRLINETDHEMIAIPSDALIFDNDHYYVVIEKAPNNYEIRNIQLQGHSNNISYISSGLNEGENVVTKNQLLLYSQITDK